MDIYYNPQTQETLTRLQLKILLHASIPAHTEEVEGWYLLHNGAAPATEYGQSIEADTIELVNGVYVQQYRVVGTPQEPVESYEELLESRLSDVEDALIELAEILTEGE